MTTIADQIKAYRKRKKLTQHGMAKLTGVPRISLARWENGVHKPNYLSIAYLIKKRIIKKER